MSFTILHTESSMGWGGQENRTFHESLGMKRMGAGVIILCQPGSELGRRASAEGIEVKACRMRKSYDVPAIRFILKLIKAEGIDIISTHSGRDSFLAGIAGRLSKRKPRIVRTRHLALPITSKITYGLLPHMVVTTSEFVRKYLISEGIKPEKIIACPTGIDIDSFDPGKVTGTLKKEMGLDNRSPLIGIVAILRLKKGHHILLEAAPMVLKEFPEAVFVFAGDGPQRRNLSRRIKDQGLSEKVIMLGLRNDVSNIMKSLDVLVLPTLQESLAQSILQAMAMEKPVVATNVGGVGEAVKDGVNGYLVEPNNPAALANAVIKILRDREMAAAMGARGREMVRQGFTLEGMYEKMFGVYSSLLKEKAG